MKFKIKILIDGYYIFLDNEYNRLIDYVWDNMIANYLELTEKEYINILKLHNAYQPSDCINYYFENKKDAEAAIEELEPYLVMIKLVK